MIIVVFQFLHKVWICSLFNVIQAPQKSEKSRQRFYIIAAVSGVVVVALVLIAILVGMYMFTEAEKEIIQASCWYL